MIIVVGQIGGPMDLPASSPTLRRNYPCGDSHVIALLLRGLGLGVLLLAKAPATSGCGYAAANILTALGP